MEATVNYVHCGWLPGQRKSQAKSSSKSKSKAHTKLNEAQSGSFIRQAQQRFYACSARVAPRACGAASHTAASVAAVARHQWHDGSSVQPSA